MLKFLFAAAAIVLMFASGVGSRGSAAPTPTPRATTAGGSYQVGALEGCVNRWLFNGVWRVRVTKVAPMTDAVGLPGFSVSFEVRNGSKTETNMLVTGLPSHPGSLILDDGSELDGEGSQSAVAWNNVYFKQVPPSGDQKFTIPFLFQPAPAKIPKPVKWLLSIDASKEWSGAPRYSTKSPSLRIDLTCDKGSH